MDLYGTRDEGPNHSNGVYQPDPVQSRAPRFADPMAATAPNPSAPWAEYAHRGHYARGMPRFSTNVLSGVIDPVSPVRWGISIREPQSGTVLATHRDKEIQPIASVGKIILLLEIARRLETGELDAMQALHRDASDAVADSGLWQHLVIDSLPTKDLAALVGAVSDNLATNVLLRELGLGAVDAVATDLGLKAVRLHDFVRDNRTPADPPTLATGTADELSWLMGALYRGEVTSPAASDQVLHWLSLCTDLSMVASAFGLDPLSHVRRDRGIELRNKTGTDTGIRADVGVVAHDNHALTYAVLAQWDFAQCDARDEVLATMRLIGENIRSVPLTHDP